MADPTGQPGGPPHHHPRSATGAGAAGWDLVVARAVHAARVFGPEADPAAHADPPPGVPAARWELALSAQGAARLLSGLWIEATARGLPAPAELAAAIGALSAWSKELAAVP